MNKNTLACTFARIHIEFVFLSLTYSVVLDLRHTDVAEGVLFVSYLMYEFGQLIGSEENH